MDNQLNEAIKLVGPDARPSGRLRIARGMKDELQQEWIGNHCSVWLKIPVINIPVAEEHSSDLQKR